MVAFCVLISLSAVLLAYKIYESVFNPVTLFAAPFVVCVCLASSGMFGIYVPTDVAVGYITIAVATFACGGILVYSVGEGMVRRSAREQLGAMPQDCPVPACASFRRRMFYVLLFAALVISIPYLMKTIPLLLGGSGLTAIKFEYANGVGSSLFTTRELLLFNWFVIPAFRVAFLVLCYSLAKFEVDVPALAFSVIGMAVVVCVSGGRDNVFVFVILAIISLAMSPHLGSIWRRLKALPTVVKVVAVLGVLALCYITSERSLSERAGIIENVFFYFAGAITYFSQIVSRPSLFDLGSNLFYGGALLGFVTNPITVAIAILTGGNVRGTENLISTSASVYLKFSDELSGNALCTCIYPFMRDFGVAGVFLGPFLYGCMAAFVWKKWRTSQASCDSGRQARWFMVTAYLSYCLLFSVWRYVPLFTSTGMILFLTLLLTARPLGLGAGTASWRARVRARGLLKRTGI